MPHAPRRLASRVQGWLLSIGAFRATLAITAVSVLLSIVITWVCLVAIGFADVPLHSWLVTSIVVPLCVAPFMFGLVISLAYQLAAAKSALAEAAATDALTGVANRRSFMDRAAAALDLSAPATGPVPSLLLLDVDHFKAINDRYGHAMGDAVLVEVARRCAATLDAPHLFARLGGEEFVALVSAPEGAVRMIAEAMRAEVSRIDLDGSGRPLGVTVSIGIAGGGLARSGLDGLLAEADRQLYAAKNGGRNRVAGALAAA